MGDVNLVPCVPLQVLSEEEWEIISKATNEAEPVEENKFYGHFKLKAARPADAVQGLEVRMSVDTNKTIFKRYYDRISREVEGIYEEVAGLTSDSKDLVVQGEIEDIKDLLDYICSKKTELKKEKYENGIVDNGMRKCLIDFMADPKFKQANLSKAELVAMRLYTTVAYRFMNPPLRDEERYQRGEPCPLPVTTFFACNGIRKARQLCLSPGGVDLGGKTLWRGMRNREVGDGFRQQGGTELAFMSTTQNLNVAVNYCLQEEHSPNSLLFKIISPDFMSMGADVQWLSAFPGEAEIIFPPLTYLKPTGRSQVMTLGQIQSP
jgi:hypothetical protein